MGEVARKQVELPVFVEISPCGPNRMASLESGGGGDDVVFRSLVRKSAGAVVNLEEVGLEAVVRNVNVEVPVSVEVAGRDASGPVFRLLPSQSEPLSLLVMQDQRWIGDLLSPVLIASDVQIDEAIVVEVSPAGASRDRRGQVPREG